MLWASSSRPSRPTQTSRWRLRGSSVSSTSSSSADVEGVIAAVNAYIGSLAAVFLSLANSMWTFLQRFLFPHGTTVHLEPIACSQAGPQRSAPLILFVAGKPTPDVEAPDAREEYLKALNGAIRCNGNKMESTAEELARAT